MPERTVETAPLLLAIDTGSPRISVALGRGPRLLAAADRTGPYASRSLLELLDSCLRAAGVRLRQVDGVLALRGPGSFTGLRVGLATALGLHQALAVPATGLPTLEVLAAAAPPVSGRVVAVVEALRGDWYAQSFAAPGLRTLGPARRLSPAELVEPVPEQVVGYRVARLAEACAWPLSVHLHEPGPLAPIVLQLAVRRLPPFDPSRLISPLYLEPAAARPVSR